MAGPGMPRLGCEWADLSAGDERCARADGIPPRAAGSIRAAAVHGHPAPPQLVVDFADLDLERRPVVDPVSPHRSFVVAAVKRFEDLCAHPQQVLVREVGEPRSHAPQTSPAPGGRASRSRLEPVELRPTRARDTSDAFERGSSALRLRRARRAPKCGWRGEKRIRGAGNLTVRVIV